MKDAAIAGEDPRFYDHGGIDIQGTVRAAVTTATGRETQGGSSIAQQYVKNVRVQECERMADITALEDLTEEERAALTGDERHALIEEERLGCYDTVTETTIDRKLKEMRLAIGVEKRYTKNEILLGYLNIAGFGGTVYGIEAAANYYYSTSAANLSLAQAASLMAIVNNPAKFQLDKPDSETNGVANGYAENTARRNYILTSMLEQRKITQAEFDTAIATPVQPAITEPSTGCQTAGGSAYFCDYVKNILQNDPIFGEDAETRMLNFRRGGYEVYTTLDLDLQNAAESAIAQNVPQTYPGWDVGAVISSVQVGTGRVLAMAQNRTYSQDPAVLSTGPQFTSINYNTDYDYGGSSGFQPGSSYKVFTLAEWLKTGHGLAERVDSRPKSNWGVFQDSCLGPHYAGNWNPRNDANESGGNYSALESTIGSINTGFIGMAKQLDLCGIRQTAEAFGVHRADGDPLVQGPSSVIGTNEVAPLSMAVAFAGIANNGLTCSPDRDRPHRRTRRRGDPAARQHLHAGGVARGGGRDALRDGSRDDRRHGLGVVRRHVAAGAAHRQDRHDGRGEGHLDVRGELEGGDGRRRRQRQRRGEPARDLVRERAGRDGSSPHVAGRDVGRGGEVRWRPVHGGRARAGRAAHRRDPGARAGGQR